MHFSYVGRGKTVTRRTADWEDRSRATGVMNPDSDSNNDPDDPMDLADPEELKKVKPNDYIIWRYQGEVWPALVKTVLKTGGFRVVNMKPVAKGKFWKHGDEECRSSTKWVQERQVLRIPAQPRLVNQTHLHYEIPEMAAYQWGN